MKNALLIEDIQPPFSNLHSPEFSATEFLVLLHLREHVSCNREMDFFSTTFLANLTSFLSCFFK